ncbi:hypothetical protein GF340_00835 [Candidatus Peregrinibacteria bacterium]|nr:hypothetical protein [Candidatus Peregrinibacteria bacterium]
MNYFETWREAIQASLNNVWAQIVSFIPELVGALIVLIIGLILANLLGRLVYKLVTFTKIDSLLKKIDMIKKLNTAGVKVNFSSLIGDIVKWFFIIVTLIAVVEILQFTKVVDFLNQVAFYLPNVVIAVLILAIGLVFGQFVYDVIEKSAKTSKVTKGTAHMLALLGKWSIVIFALLSAIIQLGVAIELIQILFTGFVAMLALGVGLSFGLGGKEQAKKWIEKNWKIK